MSDRIHNEELSLPDDLAEVAAQLADDAEHLATTYPAGKPDLWEAEIVRAGGTPHQSRSATWFRGMAAAAAILVIVPTTWYASGLPWFGEETTAQETTTTGFEINPSLLSDYVLTSFKPNGIAPPSNPGSRIVQSPPKQPTHVVIAYPAFEHFLQQLKHHADGQSRRIRNLEKENAELRAELKQRGE